jgi:hypothetical protein
MEPQLNRDLPRQEMMSWLTPSGFSPVTWFAGFTDNETISDDTWHIVAVTRRN